jgi:hypothetical protein
VVESLLAAGADVHARNQDGCTPLHYAAQNGHELIVGLLLERNANVNVASTKGNTPLTLAALKGHKEVVESLLTAGADMHARNKDGWTPLHYAAHDGHKDTVELLLANGANADKETKRGDTACGLAAQSGHSAVAALLRPRRASVGSSSECYSCRNQRSGAYVLVKCGIPIASKTEVWAAAPGFKTTTTYRVTVEDVFFVCTACMLRHYFLRLMQCLGITLVPRGIAVGAFYADKDGGLGWLVIELFSGLAAFYSLGLVGLSLLPMTSRPRGELVTEKLVANGEPKSLMLLAAKRRKKDRK